MRLFVHEKNVGAGRYPITTPKSNRDGSASTSKINTVPASCSGCCSSHQSLSKDSLSQETTHSPFKSTNCLGKKILGEHCQERNRMKQTHRANRAHFSLVCRCRRQNQTKLKDRTTPHVNFFQQSATPATQSEGGCHKVPRLPRKTPRRHSAAWEPSATPKPTQSRKCHACHAK